MGCWVFDLEHKSSWWSDSYYEMLKLEDKNKNQTLEEFLDHTVHPADRHLVAATITNYLSHRALSDKHEVRLKNSLNEYNWYETFSEAKYDEKGKIQYVFGAIININPRKHHQAESNKLKFILDVAEEMTGIGALETNFVNGARYWSKIVYEIMELPSDTDINLLERTDFFEPADEALLADAIAELRQNGKAFDLDLKLTTGKKNRIWIRLAAKPVADAEGNIVALRGMMQKIERHKLKENFLIDIRNKITDQKFFLDETSAMSKVGGWEIDFGNNSLYWAEQTKAIYEVEPDYVPTVDESLHYYSFASREQLAKSISNLVDHHQAFDLELELTTAKNNKIWVRSNGKPITDKSGKLVKIRGVIQDISEQKQREMEVNQAMTLINDQNNKLKDFAYIVSHNLRSHTGNLKMIAEMIEMETDPDIKMQWVDMIQQVSVSLSHTVNNLTGIVNFATAGKSRISFKDVFRHLQKTLNYKLQHEDVNLQADFSACEYIDYVPAYLESIMLNLVTNAIKYKHPQRKPKVTILTYLDQNQPCLQVSDNGLGIDLQKHGNRLFKMNQTFHTSNDSRGIGLFITKNQVESMGGTIDVDSVLEEGTTFTVHF